VAILDQLLQREPQAAYLHSLLGRCYMNLADVLKEMGDEREAEEMLRKGRAHRID
jgi:hypothetical protein